MIIPSLSRNAVQCTMYIIINECSPFPYLMLMGCCTGRSQSVYSLIIVANISFKWKLYVLRTYVRSIFARRSASMPYWMSSELNEKNASARVTPTIKSYLSDIDVIIIPEGGSISKNERKRKTKKNAKSLRNGCIKKMKCAIEWKKCVKLVDLPSSTRRRCHPRLSFNRFGFVGPSYAARDYFIRWIRNLSYVMCFVAWCWMWWWWWRWRWCAWFCCVRMNSRQWQAEAHLRIWIHADVCWISWRPTASISMVKRSDYHGHLERLLNIRFEYHMRKVDGIFNANGNELWRK